MTAPVGSRFAEVVGVGSVALVEVAMAVSLAALIVRDGSSDQRTDPQHQPVMSLAVSTSSK